MNSYRAVGLGFVLVVLLSCSVNGDEQMQGLPLIPVQHYSGYQLPELLKEHVDVKKLADVSTLLDMEWYATFTLVHPGSSDKTLSLSSCAQLKLYAEYTLTTLNERDNIAFMEVMLMCKVTDMLIDARPAERSFIDALVLAAQSPNQLPAQVALVTSESESQRLLNDSSIKTWADINKDIVVKSSNATKAYYVHDAGEQELEWIAKGDFNHDGFEDLMFSSRDAVSGGSYAAMRLFVVTKRSADSEFQMLHLWPKALN